MKYPEFLPEHGVVGFVAPSFGCNIEPYRSAFDNAQKKFRALGHRLAAGPNCYEGKGIGISNTPEACGKELTDYYCGDEADILISCGGGELMCEILEYVDFERIGAAKPKWYMGYSDNTNMTFLLATLCDTASVYGPCAAAFGMEPWHESLADAYALLRGKTDRVHGYPMWEREGLKDEEHPLAPYHVTEERKLRVFLPDRSVEDRRRRVEDTESAAMKGEMRAAKVHSESGKMPGEPCAAVEQSRECVRMPEEPCAAVGQSRECVRMPEEPCVAVEQSRERVRMSEEPCTAVRMEGRLLGGCMDCLVNLTGTRYDRVKEFTERYQEDGILWFLESCDLNVMAIRRAVWQMKNAGWFSHVKGFLIGRPLVFGQELMGLDQYHAVCDLLGEYGVPVIMDVDLGHLPPMMPLICGSYAAVTVEGNEIEIRMLCSGRGNSGL